MSKLFIQPFAKDEFDLFLEYAEDNDLNLEIATFASPRVLDGDWHSILEHYRNRLKGFRGIVSIHGPFMEMVIHSRDSKIAEAAGERIYQALKIADLLGTRYAVFHGNFNPLINHPSYMENWLDRQAAFWTGALDRFETSVLLENVWDREPDIYRQLLDRIKSDRLKICFDTGHANIYSEVSMKNWFEILGKDIPYIHVNDNKGEYDSEGVPGRGNIDWQAFSDIIRKLNLSPNLVFEVGGLDRSREALEFFRKNGLYPFD